MVVALCLIVLLTGCSFTEISGQSGERYGLPEVEIEMAQEDFYNLDKESFVSEWAGASLAVEDTVLAGAIRRHGSSSRKLYKNSYCIRTADRDRIYSAQPTDTSYLRYMLAAFLFNKAGVTCGEVSPVWLNINGSDQGLYLYREPVDLQFYQRHNLEPASIYSMTGASSFLLNDEKTSFHSFKKEYPHKSISQKDLVNFLGVVSGVWKTENWDELESVVNVYEVLDYYAVSRLINGWDGFMKNLHLWRDGRTGKFSFTPWDLNFTFLGELEDSLPHFSNGFFELLMENDDYYEYVVQREQELFDYNELVETVTLYRSRIEEAYAHDPYINRLNWQLEPAYQDIIRYLQSVERILTRRNSE